MCGNVLRVVGCSRSLFICSDLLCLFLKQLICEDLIGPGGFCSRKNVQKDHLDFAFRLKTFRVFLLHSEEFKPLFSKLNDH